MSEVMREIKKIMVRVRSDRALLDREGLED